MRCKAHPKYAAVRQPVKTAGHPDGCPTCWGVWEHAKTDPRRLVKTVNVELTPDELRTLVVSLEMAMRTTEAAVAASQSAKPQTMKVIVIDKMRTVASLLKPLHVTLVRALKGRA